MDNSVTLSIDVRQEMYALGSTSKCLLVTGLLDTLVDLTVAGLIDLGARELVDFFGAMLNLQRQQPRGC